MNYLTIAMLFGLLQNVHPQSSANLTVTGFVFDAETGLPIELANIFLASSSIGDVSNKDGYYEIRSVPPGKFDLVASVIGYEIEKSEITSTVSAPDKLTINFDLVKKAIELPVVIVTGRDKRIWKRRLAKFTKNFLGESQNGKGSYIQNENVLRFEVDESGTLTAHAYEPLVIINLSLGYKIDYILDDFELTAKHVRYSGSPHFNEITASSLYELKEWKENRKNTHKGSLRHFLTTICDNYDYTRGDMTEREKVFRWRDVIERSVKVTYKDSSHIENEGFYVLKVDDPFRKKQNATRQLVNTNWFLKPSDNPSEMYLQLNGYLEVTYENEFFPFRRSFGTGRQTSWIQSTMDLPVIDKQGRYYDKYSIKTSGTWAKERVADMLPFNYTSDN